MDAPLDRLNSLLSTYEAMTSLRVEVTINQFDEFQLEIHASVARLKKAGLWMRQIVPLVAPAVRVLVRMSELAQDLEKQSISTQRHGFRELSKASSALLQMVEVYESGETILFSDEMKVVNGEDSSSRDQHGGPVGL